MASRSEDRFEIAFFNVETTVPTRPEHGFTILEFRQNYLRPGESIILLHVRPTSVLYVWSRLGLCRPQRRHLFLLRVAAEIGGRLRHFHHLQELKLSAAQAATCTS
ncbi:hypothetical protein ACFX2G_014825 [Malus domestica]